MGIKSKISLENYVPTQKSHQREMAPKKCRPERNCKFFAGIGIGTQRRSSQNLLDGRRRRLPSGPSFPPFQGRQFPRRGEAKRWIDYLAWPHSLFSAHFIGGEKVFCRLATWKWGNHGMNGMGKSQSPNLGCQLATSVCAHCIGCIEFLRFLGKKMGLNL